MSRMHEPGLAVPMRRNEPTPLTTVDRMLARYTVVCKAATHQRRSAFDIGRLLQIIGFVRGLPKQLPSNASFEEVDLTSNNVVSLDR